MGEGGSVLTPYIYRPSDGDDADHARPIVPLKDIHDHVEDAKMKKLR